MGIPKEFSGLHARIVARSPDRLSTVGLPRSSWYHQPAAESAGNRLADFDCTATRVGLEISDIGAVVDYEHTEVA